MNVRVGIVGAGLMGRTIALRAVESRLDTRLYDVAAGASAAAMRWVADQAVAPSERLAVVESIDALSDRDVIIEAVVENRSVKRRVLKTLSAVSPTALIATNTSSLSVTELAEAVAQADRFCGLHFCHPIAECPLVEVVAAPATAAETLIRAESFVRRMRLEPLRTRDVPGFAVNRLLFPYLEAAIALVRGGVEWRRIEHAATGFGMRLGPLSQMDEIGIDVILRAAAAFHRGNPVVPPQSELLLALYQAGRLGRKSDRGFFDYSGTESPLVPDAEAVRLSGAHRAGPIECSDAELTLRLFVPMVSAACGLVEQNVVDSVSGVRAALTRGLNCRGQAAELPTWAERVGRNALVEWGERLQLPQFEPEILG